MRKAFGRRTIARPSATRCRSPPASAETALVEQTVNPQEFCRLFDTLVDLVASAHPGKERKPIFLRTFICG